MAQAVKLVNNFFQSVLEFVETSQMARAERIVSNFDRKLALKPGVTQRQSD